MADYPIQNNQVTRSLQVYAKAMELFADIVLLAHTLRNSKALVIDEQTGAVAQSSVTDETLEGRNEVIKQLSVVVGGETISGAAAWQVVTAALITLPMAFPDDFASFMQISSEAAQ